MPAPDFSLDGLDEEDEEGELSPVDFPSFLATSPTATSAPKRLLNIFLNLFLFMSKPLYLNQG
jgi:hypothetical protein